MEINFPQTLFALAVLGASGFATVRVYGRAKPWGVIMAAGLALRVGLGFGLLALSFSNAPMLRGFHTGDGFWVLAPDARVYYALARQAAHDGLSSVTSALPSPVYVGSLGAWMWAGGATLGSAVLFNVACFVATCLVIVSGVGRRTEDRQVQALTTVALSSFAFSPMLLLSSTQALKDPFFALLIAVAVAGAFRSFDVLSGRSPIVSATVAAGTALLVVSQYALTGIRAYYGVLICAAYAVAVVSLFVSSRVRSGIRGAVGGVAVFAMLWTTCTLAGGAYYQQIVTRTIGVGGMFDFGLAGRTAQHARRGFVESGGSTNLVDADFREEPDGARRGSAIGLARDVMVGVSAMLVPISILREAGVVSFHGGRGLLAVTDLDTVFLDVTLLAMAFLILRRADWTSANITGFVFVSVLVCVSGGLLGYVVTNYGTLFRLRLFVVAPVWVLGLACCAPRDCAVQESAPADMHGRQLDSPAGVRG